MPGGITDEIEERRKSAFDIEKFQSTTPYFKDPDSVPIEVLATAVLTYATLLCHKVSQQLKIENNLNERMLKEVQVKQKGRLEGWTLVHIATGKLAATIIGTFGLHAMKGFAPGLESVLPESRISSVNNVLSVSTDPFAQGLQGTHNAELTKLNNEHAVVLQLVQTLSTEMQQKPQSQNQLQQIKSLFEQLIAATSKILQ